MKRAVLYLRVSTIDQTTANQERELREIAGCIGCEITEVYKDHGISGAKGRDKRPGFDARARPRQTPPARNTRVSPTTEFPPAGIPRTCIASNSVATSRSTATNRQQVEAAIGGRQGDGLH
jgi:Resolvase, N terminal domain